MFGPGRRPNPGQFVQLTNVLLPQTETKPSGGREKDGAQTSASTETAAG